jgi:UDP-glucose 4-epimerase
LGTHLVTGAAGFIGVNLVSRLLQRGHDVMMVDDLSSGSVGNIAHGTVETGHGHFIQADCGNSAAVLDATRRLDLPPIEDVWHLAANSDIPAGLTDPTIDIKRTFLTTSGLLLMLKQLGPARVHFASSSAVYGDHLDASVMETTGPLEPISYYGAMKLASEALLRAGVESFIPQANILRFANIVGTPATHGVILDFVTRLKAVPTELVVMGDGSQRKPYLHVSDLIDAMMFVADHASGRFNVFNLGPPDAGITVAQIARIVVEALAPEAALRFGSEARGWVGDVPRFRLTTKKLTALGWTPRLTSEQAVRLAVAEIIGQGRSG